MKSSAEKNIVRIALIGFMGCGKTSIGKILADRLDVGFVDLDREIESSSGLTIAEVFSKQGEAGFRALEESSLAALAEKRAPQVLSCGGGIILSPRNRELLKSEFVTVWIDVPFAELLRRLAGERKKRPLLGSDDYALRAERLFLDRRPLYAETSRFTVRWQEGETVEASALKIAENLGIG